MPMKLTVCGSGNHWFHGFGVPGDASCVSCPFLKESQSENKCRLFLTEERLLGENQMPLKTVEKDGDLDVMRCADCVECFPFGAELTLVAEERRGPEEGRNG